jgi:hypothetical protein
MFSEKNISQCSYPNLLQNTPIRNIQQFKDTFNPRGKHYGLAYFHIHGVAFGAKNISTTEKTTKSTSDSSD